MKQQHTLTLLLLGLIGLLISGTVASGPLIHTIDWDVQASGGGHFEQGIYSLDNTIGQPVIGPTSGGNLDVHSGYWQVFNSAPVANPDNYNTPEDTTLNEPAPGVLANDMDVNGDPLTAVLITSTSNGSLALNANGSFTYTPDADYCGLDSFTYQANDGLENSGTATVTINISCEDEVIYLPMIRRE